MHPSVKTSMHVFDHTIKPILLYSCEIWGAFNPMSSKYRNGIFSFDHIYSKLPAEKLHTKFCKFILGAPKKSTNFAVLTELGRLPIYFNMIKAMTKYYYRLEKSDTNFPLLYNAFIESKKLYESKKPSWYMSSEKLLSLINNYQISSDMAKPINNRKLRIAMLKDWEKNLKTHSEGKLCTYVTFKANFGCEKYLDIVKKFEDRRSLTRFRISAHHLLIERGRYSNTPRHNRICKRCCSNEVEDETHFLFNCDSLSDQRKDMITMINNCCKNFKNLDPNQKLIWLMNNEDENLLSELCMFIKKYEKF